MPVDYKHYPSNWRAVSRQIRFERAEGRCECVGECGTDHGAERCQARNNAPHPDTKSRVVLTAAHLCTCHPLCSEPGHLKAMCNRCHLRLDAKLHAKNARRTRQKRRIEAGALFDYAD